MLGLVHDTSRWAGLDIDEVDLYRGRGYRLFKTLLSTGCRMDCRYCPLSRFCRRQRSMWEPRNLVDHVLASYRARRIDGFFLSSTLYGDPDRVVERELEVAEALRRRGYKGYLHLRLMPGTSMSLVERAAELADRVGLNIEAPPSIFPELAPSKGDWLQDIVKRLEWLTRLLHVYRGRRGPGYLSRGVDTQLVLGALDETDEEVLETIHMVLGIGVTRVYISGFRPYPGTPLENRPAAPAWRAHRVMQAVELMRSYGFTIDMIRSVLDDKGMLPNRDPKLVFAERNPGLYPVDVSTATYAELLLVPGIGPATAARILALRRTRRLTVDTLRRVMGIKRFNRAYPYISLP